MRRRWPVYVVQLAAPVCFELLREGASVVLMWVLTTTNLQGLKRLHLLNQLLPRIQSRVNVHFFSCAEQLEVAKAICVIRKGSEAWSRVHWQRGGRGWWGSWWGLGVGGAWWGAQSAAGLCSSKVRGGVSCTQMPSTHHSWSKAHPRLPQCKLTRPPRTSQKPASVGARGRNILQRARVNWYKL